MSDRNTGPLSGLHVLDLSTYVAGPSASMTLAQLGADVVRIDPLGGATDTLRLPVDGQGNSLYWAGLNKGKRSVEADLSSESGRDLVRSLLAVPGPGHGIVITNSVGQRWLTYDELRAHREDLIHIHITGGPSGAPAVDYTVNAETGLPWLTGPRDVTQPVNHVLPAWDLLAGLQAVIAVLTAERVRRETGQGQSVTLSLADVAVATMGHLGFVADVAVNGADRLRDGNYLYGSYGSDFVARDGRRVMIIALTKRQWRNLVTLTGTGDTMHALEESLGVTFTDERVRYEHRDVITAVLARWFALRSYDEIVAALGTGQVLWGPYRTVEELVTDPASILGESTIMHDVDQPGIGRFPVPGPVIRLSGTPAGPPRPAPRLGADTDEVVAEWLSGA
jgi:2-methylfumaryl-CoA isomerase